MSARCVRAHVTGKVQGVGYRRAAQEQALQRNITGYARNLPGGQVEVLMFGQSDAVTALGEWLWQGPNGARVTHVTFEVMDDGHAPDHFATY